MAAGQMGQHQVGTFATPANGTVNNATDVVTNDNALGAALDAHDNDSAIHLPSGAFSARPAAGTASNSYFATDTRQIFTDTGSAWAELTAGAMARKAYVVTDPQYSSGADPTGVADSSAAFNAASVAASSGGGFVYVPAGTYLVDGWSVRVPVIGAGREVTTIKHKGSAAADAYAVQLGTGVTDYSVEGLTFDGNAGAQSNRTRVLSFAGSAKTVRIRKCRVTNTVSGGFYLLGLTLTAIVEECVFDAIPLATDPTTLSGQSNAIYATGTTGRLIVRRCEFLNTSMATPALGPCAIQAAGTANTDSFTVLIEDNVAEYFGCNAAGNPLGTFEFYQFGTGTKIIGNTIRRPGYSGIKMANCAPAIISNNTVYDVQVAFTGALISWSGNLRTTSARWQGLSVTGNVCHTASVHRGYSIDVSTNQDAPGAASAVAVTGNVMRDVYSGIRVYGLSTVALTGNVVDTFASSSTSFPGLLIQQVVGNVNVVGGAIIGGGTLGVSIIDTLAAARVLISGVQFGTNTTAHIKCDDTIAASTILLLAVMGCTFQGAIQSVNVNRATTLILRGNHVDSGAVAPTKTTIGTEYGQGTNSWDTQLTQILRGTATYANAGLAGGSSTTTTVTVTGAAVGDVVIGVAHANWAFTSAAVMTGQVSSANTVTVTINNPSGSSLVLSSGTLAVVVAKSA